MSFLVMKVTRQDDGLIVSGLQFSLIAKGRAFVEAFIVARYFENPHSPRPD